MPLTPQQRSTRASIAAYSKVAQQGVAKVAQNVIDGQLKFYLRLVDPEGVLDEADRMQRAIAARRAHMRKASLASSRARQRRREKASS